MERLKTNRDRSGRYGNVVASQQDPTPQEPSLPIASPTLDEKLAATKAALLMRRAQESLIQVVKQNHQAAAAKSVPEPAIVSDGLQDDAPGSSLSPSRTASQGRENLRAREIAGMPTSARIYERRPILATSFGSSGKKKKRVSFRMDSESPKHTQGEFTSHTQNSHHFGGVFVQPASNPDQGRSGFASTESSPPDDMIVLTPAYTPTEVGSPYETPVGSFTSTPDTTPNISMRNSMIGMCQSPGPTDIRAPQTGKRVDQYRNDAATSLKEVLHMSCAASNVSRKPSRIERLLSRISSSA
jgi:hypothetical protein